MFMVFFKAVLNNLLYKPLISPRGRSPGVRGSYWSNFFRNKYCEVWPDARWHRAGANAYHEFTQRLKQFRAVWKFLFKLIFQVFFNSLADSTFYRILSINQIKHEKGKLTTQGWKMWVNIHPARMWVNLHPRLNVSEFTSRLSGGKFTPLLNVGKFTSHQNVGKFTFRPNVGKFTFRLNVGKFTFRLYSFFLKLRKTQL